MRRPSHPAGATPRAGAAMPGLATAAIATPPRNARLFILRSRRRGRASTITRSRAAPPANAAFLEAAASASISRMSHRRLAAVALLFGACNAAPVEEEPGEVAAAVSSPDAPVARDVEERRNDAAPRQDAAAGPDVAASHDSAAAGPDAAVMRDARRDVPAPAGIACSDAQLCDDFEAATNVP